MSEPRRTLDGVSEIARAGICGRCAWARPVVSGKGSTFLRCDRHDLDPARYRKYPALPRMHCDGLEPRVGEAAATRPEA